MADQRLVDYIKKQKQAGYSDQQLRDFLVKNGYNTVAVDTAIKEATKAEKFAKATAKPAGNTLVPYIKQYLGQGYTVEGIRNFLIKKGYPTKQVDEAIHDATHPKVTHTIDISPKVIATILVLVLGLGLIGASLYYFMGTDGGSSPELLDYSISIQDSSIEPGGTLYFTNDFVNFGSDRRYDISVEYIVSNRDTGEEVTAWKEIFAIDTLLTKQMSVEFAPDMQAGNYMIKGIVDYGDFEGDAYRTFKVVSVGPEESCYDGIMNQDETNVDCGGICGSCESCYDGIMNQDETGVDCGGVSSACTTTTTDTVDYETPVSVEGETYDQSYVLGLTQTDASAAAEHCLGYTNTENKDSCLLDVAKTSDDYTFCHDIISDLTKDDCYMSFAYQKEFGACDYIANPFVKQSCNQLKDIHDIQGMIANEDYAAVGQTVGMSVTGPDGEQIV